MVDRLKTEDPPDQHNPQLKASPEAGNSLNDMQQHAHFVPQQQMQHPVLTEQQRYLLSSVETTTASTAEEAAAAAAAAAVDHFADQAAIEAAVAAAENFGKTDGSSRHEVDHVAPESTHRHHHHNDGSSDASLMVHDPLQAAAAQAALDAAARLAHISHPGNDLQNDADNRHHMNDEDVAERLLLGEDDDDQGVEGPVLV